MHKVRKAQTKEMLFFGGVLMISIISIIFVVRTLTPSLQANREGQAKVLANYVMISSDVLTSVDGGSFQKDMGITQPLYVDIYQDPDKTTHVKVSYDDSGKLFYDVPILATIKPASKVRVTTLCVVKDKSGICVKGDSQCASC